MLDCRTLLASGTARKAISFPCFVNSFVKAKHALDGIHDGRFAVLEAI